MYFSSFIALALAVAHIGIAGIDASIIEARQTDPCMPEITPCITVDDCVGTLCLPAVTFCAPLVLGGRSVWISSLSLSRSHDLLYTFTQVCQVLIV